MAHSKEYAAAASRKTAAAKRRYIDAWKESGGCRDCGEKDPVVLDAHHRDPSTKHPALRKKNGPALFKLSWPDIRAEIEKCDVLCANCHRREWRATCL